MSPETKLLVFGEILFLFIVLIVVEARRRFSSVSRMRRRAGVRGAITIAPSRAALLARPADAPSAPAATGAAPAISPSRAALFARPIDSSPASSRRAPWEAFMSDQQMLSDYRVTPAEIESLRHTAMLGTVQSKEDILFILKTIRASGRR